MLLTLRGRWDEAEAAAPPAGRRGPGCPGQLRAVGAGPAAGPQGRPGRRALLERAQRTAARPTSVQAIALAGIAWVESALLAGDDRAAAELARVLPLERTAVRGPSATG